VPLGSLATLAADEAFPALRLAADPAYVLESVRAIPALRRAASVTAIEVLNHKPGRRCTIRYEVETPDGHRQLAGKWYRDADESRDLFSRLEALAAPPRSLSLPTPLLRRAEGLVLQAFVPGRDLRELAVEPDVRPFEAAGCWLARLHALAPVDGLKLKTPAHELSKTEAWAHQVEMGLPALATDLSSVIVGLQRLVEAPAPEPVMVHRDYYPANILWDGARVWGLDFDQMALGDAAVDAGSFLAQLEKLAIRDGIAPSLHEPKTRAFLNAYSTASGRDLGVRLRFFRAYTFLQLAAAEVQRERPRWQELAGRFVKRAAEEAAVAV
jgi:Ser/Thr protein kinase RdoA (MazF antagonist)